MSNISYEHYRQDTINLVKTMIVKHEEIAISMNNELMFTGHYDIFDNNPYHWRYYLNLNGQYHQYDIDLLNQKYGTPYIMVKIASDTGTVEVPFTKELLHGPNANKALANEYQIGSRFYKLLVDKYPDLEQLIIGILNPIDLNIAINAKNGEILYIDGLYKTLNRVGDGTFAPRAGLPYGKYIQPQEINLIPKLQTFLYNHIRNWNNQEYIHGNDLYAPTMLGILYVHLPNVIMNIRLENCKTPHAHRFHIEQYLDSHGQNGRYSRFINIESALYLYRNTLWLEANRGKELVLNTYIDKLLSPNQIPVNAYSIKQDISQMGEDNLLPHGILYKEILNFESIGASDKDREVREILTDQIPLARDNERDLDYYENKIQETIDWGGDDRVQTKILESEIFDRGELFPFTLIEMLINLWGYTSFKGYYTGSVYATHPISGERIGLTPLNAYLLASYCLNAVFKHKPFTKIPEYRFYHIPRTNVPSNYPTDDRFEGKPDIEKAWGWCVQNKTRRRKVAEVLGTHKPKFTAHSPSDFFINGKEIFDERVRKYYAYCNTEWFEERGDLHLVAERCYWHGFDEKPPRVYDQDYETWLTTIGVDLTNFTSYDLLRLGSDIVFSAIGWLEEERSKKAWTQKALLKILEHFTSYTIHWLQKYLDVEVRSLNGQTLRFSNLKWRYVKGPDGKPFAYKYRIACVYSYDYLIKNKVWYKIGNPFEMLDFKGTFNLHADLRIPNMIAKVDAPFQQKAFYNLGLEATNIVGRRLPKEYAIFPPPPKPKRYGEDTYLSSERYTVEVPDAFEIDVYKVTAREYIIHQIKDGYGLDIAYVKSGIYVDKFKDVPTAEDINEDTVLASGMYPLAEPDTFGISLTGVKSNIFVMPNSENVYITQHLQSGGYSASEPDQFAISITGVKSRIIVDPFKEVPKTDYIYDYYYARSEFYKIDATPDSYGISLAGIKAREIVNPYGLDTYGIGNNFSVTVESKWIKRTLNIDYGYVDGHEADWFVNRTHVDKLISTGIQNVQFSVTPKKPAPDRTIEHDEFRLTDEFIVETTLTTIPLVTGDAGDKFGIGIEYVKSTMNQV